MDGGGFDGGGFDGGHVHAGHVTSTADAGAAHTHTAAHADAGAHAHHTPATHDAGAAAYWLYADTPDHSSKNTATGRAPGAYERYVRANRAEGMAMAATSLGVGVTLAYDGLTRLKSTAREMNSATFLQSAGPALEFVGGIGLAGIGLHTARTVMRR